MAIPLLSVVIPAYKVEKYIKECVGSVLAQGINDLEVIVVDDGSPDSTGVIADELAAADNRVMVLHKSNGGAGSARNYGLDHASGRYVTFLDGDDRWESHSMAFVLAKAVEEDVDMALFDYVKEHPDGTVSPVVVFGREVRFTSSGDIANLAKAMVHPIPGFLDGRVVSMSGSTFLFRRSLISHRFHSERDVCSEDLPFKIECVLNSKNIIYIPHIVLFYRCTPSSLTNTFSSDKFGRYIKLTKLLSTILKDIDSQCTANLVMIYAMGTLVHSMYNLNIAIGQRLECFHKMAQFDWRNHEIDRSVLNTKERLMVWLMRSRSWRTAWAISEIYYGFKRVL